MRKLLTRIGTGVVILVITVMLGGFVYQWSAAKLELSRIPMPGRLVKIDGLSLHIHCIGQSGPTMVVDVGAGNWSSHWAHLQTALSQDGRVCLYDRAGLGWSDAWSGERTGASLSDQLFELLTASSETAPYVLVGHSLGGYVARFFQASHPDMVAGIAFVESAHEDQFDAIGGLKAATRAAEKPLTLATAMARFGLLRIINVPPDVQLPDSASHAAYVAALKTPKHWQAMRAIVPRGPDIAAELQLIDGDLGHLPILVVSAGASVRSYCEQLELDCQQTQERWDKLQQQLVRLSTQGYQVLCASATHNIQVDDPECVEASLRTFWHQVRNQSTGSD